MGLVQFQRTNKKLIGWDCGKPGLKFEILNTVLYSSRSLLNT